MKKALVLALLLVLVSPGLRGSQPVRMLLLGPPGGGKTTQVQALSRKLPAYSLSLSDLVRRQARQDDDLGHQAAAYMKAGRPVPVEVKVAIIGKDLEEHSEFLIDGFPRTPEQAQKLDEELARLRRSLTLAAVLLVEDRVVLERMALKRDCPLCHRSYNLKVHPPRQEGLCDADSQPLEQLQDDRPEALKRRLEVYHRELEPLLAYYRGQGILQLVDADGSVDQVTARLLKVAGR